LSLLGSGPVFLLTGYNYKELLPHFLEPSGMLVRDNRTNPFLGRLLNLHLCTRTGLDKIVFDFGSEEGLRRVPLVAGINRQDIPIIQDILSKTTEQFSTANYFRDFRHVDGFPPGHTEVRGEELGEREASLAYFPAGVLLNEERERFLSVETGGRFMTSLTGHIREQLSAVGLDTVMAQQGGVSTIDLITTTKGVALAHLRQDVMGPHQYIVYIGDTISQTGNDGSTMGVADYTVQVGTERDETIPPAPWPNCLHFHSPRNAREGGSADYLKMIGTARVVSQLYLGDSQV
ncbi:MAG: hypothetical protein KDD60_07830, partial [Bdellovibrionales bacterium]|nr:hypothetical protein [Bdellovibrionales bacterium]